MRQPHQSLSQSRERRWADVGVSEVCFLTFLCFSKIPLLSSAMETGPARFCISCLFASLFPVSTIKQWKRYPKMLWGVCSWKFSGPSWMKNGVTQSGFIARAGVWNDLLRCLPTQIILIPRFHNLNKKNQLLSCVH